MDEANRLREALVNSVVNEQFQRLGPLLTRLARLHVTVTVLQESGLGHLVADRHLWALAGHEVQRRAQALQAKWRTGLRSELASGRKRPMGHGTALGRPHCKDLPECNPVNDHEGCEGIADLGQSHS